MTPRWIRWIAAVLVAWPAAAAARQAPADVFGQTVIAVRFVVEGREDTSVAIVRLSDVRAGEPLRQGDVRSTIAHLDSLGRYDNIITTAVPVAGGVEVTFELVPRHPVTALDIRGNVGTVAGSLRSELQQRYGGVPTNSRPDAVAATARQLLEDEGYLQAAVTANVEVSHNPERATLVLTVDAGVQATIAHAEVQGSSPISTAEILRRLSAGPGQPYRRRQIDGAASALEDDLRARGFYEARVTVLPPPPADKVDLVVSVDTGPTVELRVEPAGALSSGDIETLIPIRRMGAVDQDLLEDSKARVERMFRADGYWHASAPFQQQLSADGKTLTIVFTVTRGPRFFIDHVEWPSTLTLPAATLRDELGVRDGEVFDQDRFLAGMVRVTDAYRRAGYYKMDATPDYEEMPGESASRALVVVHPEIHEGPRGRVSAIAFKFTGDHRVAETELRQAMLQHVGGAFVDAEAAQDRATLRTLYRNRGFLSSFVDIVPAFNADGTDVSLTVAVTEGTQVVIGQVSVVGNQRISESEILKEARLTPGQPAGDAALAEAQRRLADMTAFRRISIASAEPLAGDSQMDLIINVVEAPARTIGWGGGLEGGRLSRTVDTADHLEDYLFFAPRGFFEIGRRNLGGRNRTLDFFSRVSLQPRDAPGDPVHDGRGFGFTAYRATGTYQERHAFGTDVDLLFGTSFEQAIRTNFDFLRKGANAEALRRISDHINVSGRYALEFTRVFNDRVPADDPLQPLIDRLFPQVRLSYFSTGISWDRRNNPLTPTEGTAATADVDIAARAIGSQVGYTKIFLQGSAFHALDQSKKTVFAGRAELGLARGFPRTVAQTDANGNPVLDENGNPVVDLVQDLPASQRFFAGGGTTVRGFQLDRLGVPEILTSDGLSLGGNAVVILNAELRRVVRQLGGRNLTAVGFVDAGNVFATASSLDLTRIRGASGFGVRYDSPLGPIRLDFGFKMHREIVGGELEREWEYHLSIGEAF